MFSSSVSTNSDSSPTELSSLSSTTTNSESPSTSSTTELSSLSSTTTNSESPSTSSTTELSSLSSTTTNSESSLTSAAFCIVSSSKNSEGLISPTSIGFSRTSPSSTFSTSTKSLGPMCSELIS